METMTPTQLAEFFLALLVGVIIVGAMVGGIMNKQAEKKFLTVKDFKDACILAQGSCSGKICIKLDGVKKEMINLRQDVSKIYETQNTFTYFMGQVSEFMEHLKKG